jgi:ABC-type multidrug transport system ATPase subunit
VNGAGKTTLLSCLTGMLEPSSGTATFFGEQLDLRQDISAIQTRVGVCLQFDVFYPTLSCMEHLEFYSRLKGGISDIKKHSLELLEAVGLRGATHKLAKDLSGTYMQIVVSSLQTKSYMCRRNETPVKHGHCINRQSTAYFLG